MSTKNFSKTRLSIARKRRQLTKKSLAEKAKISQLTLTRIENGVTLEPEDETVGHLASALNYPISFFYLDDCEELSDNAVSFRSLSALTARQRDSALAAGVIAYEINDWVQDRFNLPEPNFIDLRKEGPKVAAHALRKYWGIGEKPIPNMIKLLEAKGARVFSLSESNSNLDAYSCWRNGVPYVFLNTYKSAERSRFDAAHELGHLVLHIHGENKGREVEREADQFASAFLIPRGDLVSQVPRGLTLTKLVSLKHRWGVSVPALARAIYDTQLISDWSYREFCKQISQKGYRTSEPEPRERESSVVWKKILESLWSEKLTKRDIASDLGIPEDEVEALIGGLYGGVDTSPRSEKPLLSLVPPQYSNQTTLNLKPI